MKRFLAQALSLSKYPLHDAVNKNEFSKIQELIKDGFSPNQRDELGNTPFHLAVFKEQIAVVQYLKDQGANISIPPSTQVLSGFLFSATSNKQIHKILLPPLFYAALSERNLTLIDEIIAGGFDVNDEKPYQYPVLYMAVSCLLYSQSESEKKELAEVIKHLAQKHKADLSFVDENGNGILHLFSAKGVSYDPVSLSVLEFLVIECDADVDIKNRDGKKPYDGLDAFQSASFAAVLKPQNQCYPKAVCYAYPNKTPKMLVEFDYFNLAVRNICENISRIKDVLQKDFSALEKEQFLYVVLLIAAQSGRTEMVRYLVKEFKLDVNRVYPSDFVGTLCGNALHHAILAALTYCTVSSARYLVEQCGANPHLKDGSPEQKSVLQMLVSTICPSSHHFKLIQYFVEKCRVDVFYKEKKSGNTVLHILAVRKMMEGSMSDKILEYFVNVCGMSLDEKNNKKKTPYDLAEDKKIKKTIAKLKTQKIVKVKASSSLMVKKPVSNVNNNNQTKSATSVNKVAVKQAPQIKPPISSQKSIVTEVEKSWHYDFHYPDYALAASKGEYIIPASPNDFHKALAHYSKNPVPGKEIRAIKVIYNPTLNRGFEVELSLLNERHDSPDFDASWHKEDHAEWRQQIIAMAENLTAPNQDPDYPHVKIAKVYHGTSYKKALKIAKTGYANLATTDGGFFGKGLYFTEQPEYADRVYSPDGTIIMACVCFYSAYPVVNSDQLSKKGNKGNYDLHFVPVISPTGEFSYTTTVYHACEPNQQYQYLELVAFNKLQCLPRYVIELQPNMPKEPSSFPLIEAAKKTKQEQFENTINKKTTTSLVQQGIHIKNNNNNSLSNHANTSTSEAKTGKLKPPPSPIF